MTTIIKEFNENFFKPSKLKIKWYDKDGFIRYPDYVIRISIDDNGTSGSYNGYWVEVIHNGNNCVGTVVKKFFHFKHYLDMIHRDKSTEYYHVWLNSGNFDWYISRPKNTKQLTDKIEEFISQML